ncbi:MAG: hypothetical protein NC341_04520 [Blautia sp.]|nr:hypothetical protein [Blautia sp.]MCM1200901.1 hypothetical protein [Bacteroides fragilis]
MKKWWKALLFLLPLLLMVAAVNWYVDSYAYLRVTYDEIGGHMTEEKQNVIGLEESGYNDRSLLLACLNGQEDAKEVVVIGSSRVFTFEHTMFGTDSFYNAGLSEATIYDLWAVTGILAQNGHLPETMVIGVDAFLFNTAHDNDRWLELSEAARYMDEAAGRETGGEKSGGDAGRTSASRHSTGRHPEKWLSLDYFRYNITCLPEGKRFEVSYTDDWETELYTKHYDGSVSYQKELREVRPEEVIALTEQAMEEQVVYRMTDYREIDAESMETLICLIDYLQSRHVEVILYLPPYSPMLYDYIESEEAFRITFEVEERMKQLALEKGIALYGSYDPEGSGLEMSDLYDAYHVKTEKTPDTYFPAVLP